MHAGESKALIITAGVGVLFSMSSSNDTLTFNEAP
jgi:hypothetical protein